MRTVSWYRRKTRTINFTSWLLSLLCPSNHSTKPEKRGRIRTSSKVYMEDYNQIPWKPIIRHRGYDTSWKLIADLFYCYFFYFSSVFTPTSLVVNSDISVLSQQHKPVTQMPDISLNWNIPPFLLKGCSKQSAPSPCALFNLSVTNCSHDLWIEKDQCHTSAYKRLYGTEWKL